ncbi:MAG TPA: glutamine--fructose-6-phosphate transaminase (isomerizing) [Acidimicrobiales bacterium]|nr:glutamine--fructose-6-phosphate transaminase (isomerizing) [Acidimicrobiales bacterium]
MRPVEGLRLPTSEIVGLHLGSGGARVASNPMCGIIGITRGPDGTEVEGPAANETREVLDVLLQGLGRLEYRGYDSAGVALVSPGREGVWRARAANGTRSLDDLAKRVERAPTGMSAGIGHTRWATHGRPSDENAHPHVDCSGRIALIHNGIIENHTELSDELRAAGHRFESQTDTEVLAHLIEERLGAHPPVGLAEAVRYAVGRIRGTFSVAVVDSAEPDLIVAARRVSPLVIGTAGSTTFLASDIPAILGLTNDFFVLDDGQVAELRPGSVRVTLLDGTEVEPSRITVDWDLEAARKDGYDDFMSKEIHEQPRAVADTLLDRLLPDGSLTLDEVRIRPDELRAIEKVFIVACGTSYHAGLMAKYAIEHWARLPVEIDISSEFRYRRPVLDERTLVIGVSQSGETTDTFEAVREARRLGAKVLVICNVVDSSMARESDAVLYTRAGPEIGVASTKTHVAQITALDILALYLAEVRGTLSAEDGRALLEAMSELPDKVATVLDRFDDVSRVAASLADASAFLFIGRNVGYPVALEGALKLKEISYVRAEGFPGGELKHGPIALVEPGTVVIGVATRTPVLDKMLLNVAEVKARGARVVLVVDDGDDETARHADDVLWVPRTEHLFAPVVDVVPLQIFAYALARLLGHDVDRPRNLAKVVTVE